MNASENNFIPNGTCSICLFFTNADGIISQIKKGYSNISINNDASWSASLGYIKIYAPVEAGTNKQICRFDSSLGRPDWVNQTSITSKQQTYYLTELPTITTSPYAEHDQVVVNNQDVYALETVNNTLTWVKKYSIGNINLTTITGYDSTKTQVLKNVSGPIQWVDEA